MKWPVSTPTRTRSRMCALRQVTSSTHDGGVVPSILGTCLRTKALVPRCSMRGTPWIARGSRIRVRSRREGMRVITERYSPGKLPFGRGTEAVRQMWSDVSVR
jgi:hypothetical protein